MINLLIFKIENAKIEISLASKNAATPKTCKSNHNIYKLFYQLSLVSAAANADSTSVIIAPSRFRPDNHNSPPGIATVRPISPNNNPKTVADSALTPIKPKAITIAFSLTPQAPIETGMVIAKSTGGKQRK